MGKNELIDKHFFHLYNDTANAMIVLLYKVPVTEF